MTPDDTKSNTHQLVTLEREGPIAVVSNNRPEKRNAYTDAFGAQLWDAFDNAVADPSVRCIVWRANGPSFSAGRDVGELGKPRPDDATDLAYIDQVQKRSQVLIESRVPIIAALHGWVVGMMCEYALLCDLRVASRSARLWLPEVSHGAMPAAGGLARLFQIAGHGLALDMALTGRILSADESLQLGVVSRIVDESELDTLAVEMAHRIAALPTSAVAMVRRDVGRMANPAIRAAMNEEAMLLTHLYAARHASQVNCQ